MLGLPDERLLAIAMDGERMATEAKLHSDRQYYADVAALTRAVLEARALTAKWIGLAIVLRGTESFPPFTRAERAGRADGVDECADELCTIIGGKP